jgi:AraC-like DNA-binding protein
MQKDSPINVYNNVNDFLKLINLPLSNREDFYIVRFEDYLDLIRELGTTPYSLNYFEISLCIGYDVKIAINNHIVTAKENNLVFVAPHQIVDWQPSDVNQFPSENSISFMLIFKPEFLPFIKDAYDVYKQFPYFNFNSLPIFHLSEELKQQFLNSFQTIYNEYKNNKEDSSAFIQNYLNLLLLRAKRELTFNNEFTPYKTRAEEITYNFENLLKQTAHKHQSIGYYAEQLNISPVYLSECVKKTTNKTAKIIIDEYFVMEAKSILMHSNKSISEVAFELGFYDSSNFVKYFKKRTGITPRKYKNNL